MNYSDMTLKQLREICRSDAKYYGHSCHTRKADLIKFMLFCDETLSWKTQSAQEIQEIDSSGGIGAAAAPGEVTGDSSRERAGVAVSSQNLQTNTYIEEQKHPSPYKKNQENRENHPPIPPVHSARGVVPACRTLDRGQPATQVKKMPVDENGRQFNSFLAQNFHIKFSDEVFWPPQNSGSEIHPEALLTSNRAAWGLTGIYRRRWLPSVSTIRIDPPAVLVGSSAKPVIINCPCCESSGNLAGIFTCPECEGDGQIVLSESGEGDQHPGGSPRREPVLLGERN